VNGNTISLDQDGVEVQIAADNIHKAKLVPQYDEPAGKPGKHKQANKSK
jgi:hypothetical protein